HVIIIFSGLNHRNLFQVLLTRVVVGKGSSLHLYHTPLKALKPPSTGTTIPVTKEDSFPASQLATPCSSSALPNLFIGVCFIIVSPLEVRLPSSLSKRSRFCSPRKNP